MSDVVERLRQWCEIPPPLMLEAADEIERLRGLLGRFLEAWNMGEEPDAEAITEARRIAMSVAPPPQLSGKA